MNNKNNNVVLGSPCLTPILESKKSDVSDLYLIHAFTVS